MARSMGTALAKYRERMSEGTKYRHLPSRIASARACRRLEMRGTAPARESAA